MALSDALTYDEQVRNGNSAVALGCLKWSDMWTFLL